MPTVDRVNKDEAVICATLAVAAGILIGYVWAGSSSGPSEEMPLRPLCWQTEGTDVAGYTQAHWLEQGALSGMAHQTRTSLRCRGEVNGKLSEWEADQIWVARQ